MKKNYFLLLFLLLFGSIYAQKAGDFQSKATGNWTSAASWQVFNGTSWVNASQYPGQTPGNYSVTVNTGHTVTVGQAIGLTIGNLYIKGTLVLNENFTVNAFDASLPPSLYIDHGTVALAKFTLFTLPARSNLYMSVNNSSQGIKPIGDKDCNPNTKLLIGDQVYAVCKGGGTVSFDEVNETAVEMAANNVQLKLNQNPASLICRNENVSITATLSANNPVSGTYNLSSVSVPAGYNYSRTGTVNSGTPLTFELNPFTASGDYLFRFEMTIRLNNIDRKLFINVPVSVEPSTAWNGTSWTSGAPSASNKRMAVIDADYTTALNGNITACGCTVNSGKKLTVSPGNTLTLTNDLINNGSLTVESDGNLIQINDNGTFTGNNIAVKRNARLKRLDYNYWASPVTGQRLKAFSPGTLDSRFSTYSEWDDMFRAVPNPQNTDFENNGRGYAIRASNNYKDALQDFIGIFTGKPNNGIRTIRLEKGTSPITGVSYSGNGYNLIGNPYPSNIDFYKLYNLNSSLIDNVAYFWTNMNPTPAMQGSNYPEDGWFNNYAILNESGGVPATNGKTGTQTAKPNEFIKVGQGFIVRAKSPGDLTFNNSIRTGDNSGTFFNRMSANAGQKDRFWLELTTPLQVVTTQLIGYFPRATDGYDANFDAQLLVLGSDAFYSLLSGERMAIQGKGMFNTDDVVPVGASFYKDGTYTVSLSQKEGIFAAGQAIYLKDRMTGILTDLSEGPYTFSAKKGLAEDRFEIVYKPSATLGIQDGLAKKDIWGSSLEGEFIISSSQKDITSAEVYDMKGALVTAVKDRSPQIRIAHSRLPQGIYLIKVYRGENITVLKLKK